MKGVKYIMEEKLLPGVYIAYKKDKTKYYRASITYKRKHISLGSYSEQEDANKAYLEACTLLKDYSYSVDDYDNCHILPFDKWVVLINFRDNHIYFGTPIYIRSKYFFYYLSPDCVLKFDTDDLFYFSSHKIMRRNGHLFVADYGMQVNILNRYGIKNYGVSGKDYVFVNGDATDYRRSNLKIINRYQGVSQETRHGKTMYKARINVPGYYLIGTYEKEDEAAIAYNKAIDILKKQGIDRNYTPNYTEGITPSQYADLYSKIKVSQKLYSIY